MDLSLMKVGSGFWRSHVNSICIPAPGKNVELVPEGGNLRPVTLAGSQALAHARELNLCTSSMKGVWSIAFQMENLWLCHCYMCVRICSSSGAFGFCLSKNDCLPCWKMDSGWNPLFHERVRCKFCTGERYAQALTVARFELPYCLMHYRGVLAFCEECVVLLTVMKIC